MDTNYTTQLFLSMLFFAPGVILFVGLAFVGLLMGLEKAFGHRQDALALAPAAAIDFAAPGNPAPGRIVNSLKASMNQTATQPQRKAK